MNSIVLLLANDDNQHTVSALLPKRYQVLTPDHPDDITATDIDIIIADGPALDNAQTWILDLKKAQLPIFLPVLLLTPRTTAGQRVWPDIDEILFTPIERLELQARLAMLLRTRKLSRDLHLRNETLRKRYDDLTAFYKSVNKKSQALEKSNAQKNHFLGMAAHDLRTPLGSITLYCDLLNNNESDLSEEQRQIVRRIQKSSTFMRNLIDDLLDFSTIESGKLELHPRPTDLVSLINRNIEVNRLLAEPKRIAIDFTSEIKLPPLTLDPEKIEQVLNNLLSNAVKYSMPGTRVHVHLKIERKRIVIDVIDQGQGIPADKIKHLFEPFSRVNVPTTGGEKSTGLGLAIVRRIMEGHSGSISVTSQVGSGSKFTVRLPLKPHIEPPMPEKIILQSHIRADVFDKEAALQRFGSDDTLKKHMNEILLDCTKHLTNIHQALAENNARNLGRVAYRLSSALSELSAPAALDVSLLLEREARVSNFTTARQIVQHLETELTRLRVVAQQ